MVIALFALSLVMIVGGVASVVQGFPYVRLESGLAMVISGATAASAGVILLGLAAVVQRLQRLQEAVEQAPSNVDMRMPAELPRDIPPLARPVAPPVAPSVPPAVAGAAGLAGLTVAAPFAAAKSELADASAFRIDPADRRGAAAPLAEAEPPLPHVLPPGETVTVAAPEPEPDPTPEKDEPIAADEDLFAASEATLPLRPSLKDEAKPDDAKSDEANLGDEPKPQGNEQEKAEDEDDGLRVVGTHSSGGNNYVMFANGSIQADTPRGRFTFHSLDELKAFVEAGGENDARGAA